jgi:chromosomal replication initiation ATPase DnaA
VTPEEIIADVAARHRLTVEEIVSPCRKREFVRARAEIAHRLYRTTDLTLREIGCLLGGRDHSSISYLVARYALRERVA